MNHGPDDRLDALPAGTELHGYVIESVLGHGGFGIVYQARHKELDTLVAIKEYIPVELSVRSNDSVTPRSESCAEVFEEGLKRFLDEARQLVRFQRHPCVVSCQDLFRSNGTAYLVMERVDGLPLSELLRLRETRGLPLTEAELLSMMVPLLEGLAAIHAEGVLHRDIKPANILIRRSNEQPVLIDFGAAKQVVAKQSRSFAPYTEGYAAIEQVGAGELGPWTDVYGLGAVMWRIVAGGNPPWKDPKWNNQQWSPPNPPKVEIRVQEWAFHRSDPLPSAQDIGAGRYSGHVLDAIDRCLQLAEKDRIKNCHELLEVLRRKKVKAAASTPEREIPTLSNDDPHHVLWQPKANRKSASSLAGVVAVVIAAVAAFLAFGWIVSLYYAPSLGESNPGSTTHAKSSAEVSDPPPITRESVLATFRVDPVPAGATVRLLGETRPYRPNMKLPSGEYRVRVHAPGYRSRVETIRHKTEPTVRRVELAKIGPPEKASLDNQAPPPIEPESALATFRVDPVPSEAIVRFLDETQPYRPNMRLPSGEYRVHVRAPGYRSRVETIRHRTQSTAIRVELTKIWTPEKTSLVDQDPPLIEPELGLATFRIDTVPPGATVRFLDEAERYRPDMELPSGEYRVDVRAPGYFSRMETIRHSTRPTTIVIELTKIWSPEDGVTRPTLISKVEPQYSDEARKAKLQGTVTLVIEVWADGRAHNIRVFRGLGMGLDEKAVECVKQWLFLPGTKGGKTVRVSEQIDISFRLL